MSGGNTPVEWLDIKINLCECTSSGKCTVVGQVFTKLDEILQKSNIYNNSKLSPSKRTSDSLLHSESWTQDVDDDGEADNSLRLMNVQKGTDIQGDQCKIDVMDCRIFSKSNSPIRKRPQSAFPSKAKRNLLRSSVLSPSGLPHSRFNKTRPTSSYQRRDKSLEADLDCLTTIMKDEVCLRSPDLKALVEDRIYRLEEMFQETSEEDDVNNKLQPSVNGKPINVSNSPRRIQSAPSSGIRSSNSATNGTMKPKGPPLLPKRILRYELNTPTKRMSSVEYIKMLEMMDKRRKATQIISSQDRKNEFKRPENLFSTKTGQLNRSQSMLPKTSLQFSSQYDIIAAMMKKSKA